MGQCGLNEHFSVACLGNTIAWGIAAILVCSSILIVGAGVGGIDHYFLVSNKFSSIDPDLGQGVPCLMGALGMSSNGGGLEFWVTIGRQGVCLNFPMAMLCTIIGMDVTAVELVTGI